MHRILTYDIVAPLSPTKLGGCAVGFTELLLPPPANPLRFFKYNEEPRAAPPTLVYNGAGLPQSLTFPRSKRLVNVSDLFVSSLMEPTLYPYPPLSVPSPLNMPRCPDIPTSTLRSIVTGAALSV